MVLLNIVDTQDDIILILTLQRYDILLKNAKKYAKSYSLVHYFRLKY